MISALFFFVPENDMRKVETCGRIVAETTDEAYQKANAAMTEDQKKRGLAISMARLGENAGDIQEWLCNFNEENIDVIPRKEDGTFTKAST